MLVIGQSLIKMADRHKHVRSKDYCDKLLFLPSTSMNLISEGLKKKKEHTDHETWSLSCSRRSQCNNGFPCMSQSVLINILINGPGDPGDQVCMRYVWESRSGGFGPRCAGNLMLYWRAEMCLLGAISHCLTWHGSGHPRVCAMKGFLFDARALIVGKKLPPEKN